MFSRETLPSITTLESICAAFDITMSEFFRDEEEAAADVVDEGEILKMYREMSKDAQDGIRKIMKELSDANKKQ